MKRKLEVSIGIPAYFAENNIHHILGALVKQKEINQSIKEILVYSDGSTDKTVKSARKIKDKRINVIDSKKRGGMAVGFLHMLSIYKGDAFLLLNDDIKITDSSFLDKLVEPLLVIDNVGIVGGNPQPLKPNNFVERSGVSAFRAYEEMRYSVRNGNSKYTCDGKVLLLTRGFINTITFPKNLKKIGTVDSFLYFTCIANGFLYRHVRNAILWYKFPDNLHDYISWISRNNSNSYILKSKFGGLVKEEYHIPVFLRVKALLSQFINNPPGCMFIFCVGIYCKQRAKKKYGSFLPAWELVSSTKKPLGDG